MNAEAKVKISRFFRIYVVDALSYMATGKQEYLDVAKKTANHFITNLVDDPVPLCDFRQPAEPRIYDTCAGAVAACGMLAGEHNKA